MVLFSSFSFKCDSIEIKTLKARKHSESSERNNEMWKKIVVYLMENYK